MGPPPATVAGPVLVVGRPVGAGVTTGTWVVAEAGMLAGLGSVSLPETVAVLVTVPAVAGAVASIAIVAVAPLARSPMLQVTVPEALVQVPTEEEAETNPSPAGRGSALSLHDALPISLLVAVRA